MIGAALRALAEGWTEGLAGTDGIRMTAWPEWLVPGLFATFWLTAAAWLVSAGGVESELGVRVANELRGRGFGWVEVEMSGRTVVLGGTAEVEADRAKVLAAAGLVPGVRRVADATEQLPLADPFLWSASRAGSVVTLTGARPPGEAVRRQILEGVTSRVPEARVEDRTVASRGAPEGFLPAVELAADSLTLLAEGTVVLLDGAVSVSGFAADSGAYAGAPALIAAAAPSGFRVDVVALAPPKVDLFWLEATMGGGEATLAGTIVDEDMRRVLRAAAEEAWGGRLRITDRLTLASGSAVGFGDAARAAIREAARLAEGRVRLVGFELTIEGRAASLVDYDALAALRGNPLPAGLVLVKAEVSPAVAAPYFWRGERDGASLVLTGYMPNESAHAEMLAAAAAAMPGLAMVDRLRIAEGVPRMDWVGAAEFALSQLAQLGRGSVEVNEHALSVEGAARDGAALAEFELLRTATLPASLTLVRVEVGAPIVSPYRIGLAVAAGGLVVDGYLPDGGAREAMLAAADRIGVGPVEDRTEVASGAPANLAGAVGGGLDAVARLVEGRVEIVDRSIQLEGEARFPGGAELVLRDLKAAVEPDFSVVSRLTEAALGEPLATAGCQSEVNAALAAGRVEFPAGETSILAASFPLLDRVVAALLRCPAARVEVGGHTDADGAAAYNRTISLARAESVVGYLTEAGIDAARLAAMGYGESRPVAGNGTAEEKARNRRIELTLRDGGP